MSTESHTAPVDRCERLRQALRGYTVAHRPGTGAQQAEQRAYATLSLLVAEEAPELCEVWIARLDVSMAAAEVEQLGGAA